MRTLVLLLLLANVTLFLYTKLDSLGSGEGVRLAQQVQPDKITLLIPATGRGARPDQGCHARRCLCRMGPAFGRRQGAGLDGARTSRPQSIDQPEESRSRHQLLGVHPARGQQTGGRSPLRGTKGPRLEGPAFSRQRTATARHFPGRVPDRSGSPGAARCAVGTRRERGEGRRARAGGGTDLPRRARPPGARSLAPEGTCRPVIRAPKSKSAAATKQPEKWREHATQAEAIRQACSPHDMLLAHRSTGRIRRLASDRSLLPGLCGRAGELAGRLCAAARTAVAAGPFETAFGCIALRPLDAQPDCDGATPARARWRVASPKSSASISNRRIGTKAGDGAWCAPCSTRRGL